MSKIALITDIHFGVRGDNVFFHNNLFQFLEEIFFPYLEKHEIRWVFILGDTWDKRKIINFNTLHDVKRRFFDRLQNMNISVKMIYGNHDVFYKNTNEVNSVDLLLEHYPNITIEEPYSEFKLYGTNMGMIGWLNPSNMDEGLEWIRNLKADFLFGHFECSGFGEYLDGIDTDIFERFEYVFSGHYHIPSNNGKLFYIGNPSQTNWAEYGQKRGFTILDLKTREFFLVENPFDAYLKFYYEEDNFDLTTFDFSIFSNKIVRVFVNSFELLKRKKFDLFMDTVSKNAYTAEVVEIDTNLYQNTRQLENIKTVDIFSSINQYVDAITADMIDKGRINKYFEEIYKQAHEVTNSVK